jgi:peptidase S41-like protein/tricorn protease-like protein
VNRLLAVLVAGLLVVGLLVALTACAAPGGPDSPDTAAASRPPDHVWRSVGYGWLVTLTGDTERTYETTAISCIPEKTLAQIGAPAADGTLAFGAKGTPTVTVRPGQHGTGTLHLMGSAADVDLVAEPGLPAGCSRPVPNTPRNNFDIFWQTFAENYNSFPSKNVDWAAVRAHYRPMVTDDTTSKELFGIFRDMITPLGDAHAEIDAKGGDSFAPKRPGTRDEDQVSAKKARAAVDGYLKDTLGVRDIQSYAGGDISYADLPGGQGYLRISSFSDYGGDNTFVTSSAVLRDALNSIFTAQRVAGLRGLIVDVRFNDGGDDALGLQVAGRLTNTPYVAYRKQPRTDPNNPNVWGRTQTVMVTPTPGVPHYTGPISVLTSDLTVSAGETFVEALLDRNPAPVRIGTATQGVFADNMTRRLPNGMTFTVGNERYVDPSGHDYEGAGIPPNIDVPVFTDDELNHHLDSALTTALARP